MKEGEDFGIALVVLIVGIGIVWFFINRQKQTQLAQALLAANTGNNAASTNTANEIGALGCVAGAVGSGAGALSPLCGYVGKAVVAGTQEESSLLGGSKGKLGPVESTTTFYAGGVFSNTPGVGGGNAIGASSTGNFIEGGVESVGVTSLANRAQDTSFLSNHKSVNEGASVALAFATGGISLISSQQRSRVESALKFWDW